MGLGPEVFNSRRGDARMTQNGPKFEAVSSENMGSKRVVPVAFM
jgi:hypothetical protein